MTEALTGTNTTWPQICSNDIGRRWLSSVRSPAPRPPRWWSSFLAPRRLVVLGRVPAGRACRGSPQVCGSALQRERGEGCREAKARRGVGSEAGPTGSQNPGWDQSVLPSPRRDPEEQEDRADVETLVARSAGLKAELIAYGHGRRLGRALDEALRDARTGRCCPTTRTNSCCSPTGPCCSIPRRADRAGTVRPFPLEPEAEADEWAQVVRELSADRVHALRLAARSLQPPGGRGVTGAWVHMPPHS